eukprot:4136368-Pyramimonas_sp.AAC.2
MGCSARASRCPSCPRLPPLYSTSTCGGRPRARPRPPAQGARPPPARPALCRRQRSAGPCCAAPATLARSLRRGVAGV